MGLEFFSFHRKVLDGVKEPIDMKQSNVRLVIGLFFLIIYLSIGAAIYSSMESPAESKDAQALRDYISTFKDNYGCLTDDALEKLMAKVIAASQRGISALGNVSYSPSWGFAQAFFFSGTLVSTVGYGSSSPVTPGGKAFTIFYCTIGIPLFLVLLSGFVERLKAPSVWLIAAIFMSIEKKWSYLDAFYYCFVSMTTIGLGDYTPGDQPQQEWRSAYKMFTTGYLMIGLLCMMLFLATIYDIPHLSLSRFFLHPRESDDSERAYLTNKMAPGPKYMRQVDEHAESQISPASTGSQVATEDIYQHY